MDEDRIKGQWKQLSGKLKARWGKLTNDDVQVGDGNAEYLAGRLQERYGMPFPTIVEVIGDGYYVLAFVSGEAT